MNTRILNIASGIFSFALFLSAVILLSDDISRMIADNPAVGTLLLMAVLFIYGLYFRLIFKKNGIQKNVHPAEDFDQGALLKTEEEQEADAQAADAQNTEMARELADSLFADLQAENPQELGQKILTAFARELNTVQALLFIKDKTTSKFTVAANYAFYSVEPPADFEEGEGISGQAAKDKRILNISTIPEGYITVLSGLGSSTPKHLLILPFIHDNETVAIAEASSFSPFPEYIDEACKLYTEKIGTRFFELRK